MDSQKSEKTDIQQTEQKKKPGIPGQMAHNYKPGMSGNPKGRPKGSRHKLGEKFLSALQDDFSKNGIEAIERVREKKPEHYLKIIASILPKDINVNVNESEEMSDDELIARIRELDSIVSPFLSSSRENGTDSGIETKTTSTKH